MYGTVQACPSQSSCAWRRPRSLLLFCRAGTQSEVAGIVLGCNHSFYCVLLPSMPKVPAKNLKIVKANSGEFNSQKRALRKHGLKFPKRGESQATSLEDTWFWVGDPPWLQDSKSGQNSLKTALTAAVSVSMLGVKRSPAGSGPSELSHPAGCCFALFDAPHSAHLCPLPPKWGGMEAPPKLYLQAWEERLLWNHQDTTRLGSCLKPNCQRLHKASTCYTPLHLTTSFSSCHGQNLPQSAAATSQPSQLPFYNHQGESSAGGCDRLLDWLCGQKKVGSSSLAPNCSDNTPETKLACKSLEGLRHQAPHNSTNPFQAVSWLRNQTANKAAWKSLGDVSPREDMPGFSDPSTLFPKMDHCLFQFGAWHLLGLLNRNRCSCYLLMLHIDGEAASRQGFLRLRHSPNGRDVIQIITILILGP